MLESVVREFGSASLVDGDLLPHSFFALPSAARMDFAPDKTEFLYFGKPDIPERFSFSKATEPIESKGWSEKSIERFLRSFESPSAYAWQQCVFAPAVSGALLYDAVSGVRFPFADFVDGSKKVLDYRIAQLARLEA